MIYHIYRLKCVVCSKQYVGQTSRTLIERFVQHRSDAHRGSKTRLHHHMRNHGVMNFKIKKLWSVDTEEKEIVDDFEHFFIKMLRPMLNIAIRRIREKGMKNYLREYRLKMREKQSHYCAICDLSCVARLHLLQHFETRKHKRNERLLLESFDEYNQI